ncbi:MAG: RNA methyltransferase [Oscillospiraceae bacterium]|nr:RNA methyltransferase [Oscillospiraceae bacterium]
MERLTSRRNDRIVHMKKLGAERAYRRLCGEFICDGFKMLREAIDHGAEIVTVLTAGELPKGMPADADVFEVPGELLDHVSPLKTARDVVFSCRIPGESLPPKGDGIIILERIQDPGNVGTVIRTANAFGIGTVILTGGCADIYNPKTVRATMGAIFRQRIIESELDGIRSLRDSGIRILGAALGSNSRDLRAVSLAGSAVAIGSEGSGLSDEMLAICDDRIVIPMSEECESLNAAVAASVIMWEMSGKNM